MASPMPRVPPVTTATRAICLSLADPLSGQFSRNRGTFQPQNDAAMRCTDEFSARPSGQYPCRHRYTGSDRKPERSLAAAWRRGPSGATQNKRLPLHRQSYSHAPADAQGREPLLGVAPAHFIEQGGQDARTRCADGMADGDGTAIDIHLGRIPTHVLVDGTGLGSEGLVGFHQIE